MPRLSIDLSPQEHQQIKAVAALKGMSLKQFVLSQTLAEVPDTSQMDEDEAFQAFMKLLQPRIDQAKNGQTVAPDFEKIKREAREKIK